MATNMGNDSVRSHRLVEEATTTRTLDECNKATADFFDMQPYEDLWLLSNTSENAKKSNILMATGSTNWKA